jgi:hypothetical protein
MGYLAVYAPIAKFTSIGQRIGGRIVDARLVQTSDFKTRRPEYWEEKAKTFAPYAADGTPNEPKAQLELTIDTGERDESGETERRIFIKNKRQFEALRAALKASRARQGLMIGGEIWMTLTGKEASEGAEDANTWAIEYRPPAEGGTDVPEEVHLVGGGTWSRGAAPVEPRRFAAGQAATPPPADPGLAERTREVVEQLGRAHASSPLAERMGLGRKDEEPPF